MLQDAAKRLAYTAKQVKLVESAQGVGGNFDYYWLTEVAHACLLAIGREDLAVELGEALAEEYPPPPVAWVVDLLRPLGHTPFDPLIPWAFQHLRRVGQRNENAGIELGTRLRANSRELLAWYLATKPDLTKLDLATALDAAEAWADAQAAKVVYEFPDGWTMRRLTTKRELEIEGKRMRHCVGGEQYCEDVRIGTSIIYSLRDPEDEPHATLEWDVGASMVTQAFGPGNQRVSATVTPYLVEFLTRVHGGTLEDLLKVGAQARDLLRPGMNAREVQAEGQYLNNLDLPGIDLTGAVLSGVDLTRSNLTKAILNGAVLDYADLTRTTLVEAKLEGAILNHAGLNRAELTRAVLVNAELNLATLVGADLTDANLTDAKLYKADLTRADLIGAILINANLTGADFTDADLTGANLTGADTMGADFTDADLTGVILPDGSRRA